MPEFARESNYYRVQNKALLQNLNEAQRMAVLHGEGPALVAAGPGSGKTTVITRRLLYLIQERQIPPHKILVITFTKEAAKSMQERFVSQLKQFGISRTISTGFVSFGTFHSYFYQIIRSIKKYSEYRLITQQEKFKIIKPILKESTQEDVTDTVMNKVLAQFSFFKNTGHFQKTSKEEQEELQKQFERYEAAKNTYQRMDFDDMQYLCKKALLEDKRLLKEWQERFSYLLIDEYQDISPIQSELIRMLVLPPYNLFVVGDDDQAIYGFRGADAAGMQRFLQEYKGAKQILLNVNYRCGENIVKQAGRLIAHNQMRIAKELEACEKNSLKGKIRIQGAASSKESCQAIVKQLKEKSAEELCGEAVLFRTNSAMQMMATELAGNQIPFVMREKCESIYEHFLVKDIMDYFLAACGCRDRGLILRIFKKQRHYPGREALRTEQVDFKQVKAFYRSGFYEDQQAIGTIEALERQLAHLAGMRPKLGILYILHGMEYEGYLCRKAGGTKEVPEEWKEFLHWLQEDAAGFSDLRLWQEHQALYGRELAQEREANAKDRKGVHLLTLHASKGLEFNKVYLMNLNEGTLPKYRHGEILTREKTEEERRLFYVGITRAKEEVELHYLTGTKENPKLESRFLGELKGSP